MNKLTRSKDNTTIDSIYKDIEHMATDRISYVVSIKVKYERTIDLKQIDSSVYELRKILDLIKPIFTNTRIDYYVCIEEAKQPTKTYDDEANEL